MQPPAAARPRRAHSPVQKARRAIAAHPDADADALLQCLPDRKARPIGARHPALPAAITQLLHDPDERVVEAAAANPSLPRPAMEYLISAEPDASLSDHRSIMPKPAPRKDH